MTSAPKLLLALVLLFVVFAALTLYLAGRRASAAVAEFPPTGEFIDVDGVRLHVRVEGNGLDLVLIHGASGSTRDMAFTLLESLKDSYRVILFDRPGLGYSSRANLLYGATFSSRAESPQEQAALLQKAAVQLGAKRPIVLGHSYGGAVALAWGTYHPENIAALINVSGVAMPWPGELDLIYRLTGTAFGGAVFVPMISAYTPETAVKAAIASIFVPESEPAGYYDAIGGPLTLRTEVFRANARQVNTLRPHMMAMAPDYDALRALPVEILHGTADTIVPIDIHSRPLAARLPDAVLTEIEGGGHMIHHTHPAEIIRAIDRAAEAAGLR